MVVSFSYKRFCSNCHSKMLSAAQLTCVGCKMNSYWDMKSNGQTSPFSKASYCDLMTYGPRFRETDKSL